MRSRSRAAETAPRICTNGFAPKQRRPRFAGATETADVQACALVPLRPPLHEQSTPMPPLQSLSIPENDQTIITPADVSGRLAVLRRDEVDNSALAGHTLREAFTSHNVESPSHDTMLQHPLADAIVADGRSCSARMRPEVIAHAALGIFAG